MRLSWINRDFRFVIASRSNFRGNSRTLARCRQFSPARDTPLRSSSLGNISRNYDRLLRLYFAPARWRNEIRPGSQLCVFHTQCSYLEQHLHGNYTVTALRHPRQRERKNFIWLNCSCLSAWRREHAASASSNICPASQK